MTDSYYKKYLVFGITVLFIGAGFIPNISGYNEKMSNQSTEIAASSPLNNDYLLAYWNFDECNGDTAYDSSGNGYNGTIYGATWVPHDSGCALDFDGIDDYVDLDNYAQYLGFNKDDHLIISFYFKSTSTESGMIYSLSDSNGEYPRVNIELDSKGHLVFQVFVKTCGFSLSTPGSYNDGTWHYVEVKYYGNTTKPTVEIYVDNELDSSIKDWVCPFVSEVFETAKIGRRSNNETNYFDGTIDEVKIYKENHPPYAPKITGQTKGKIGTDYNYTFTSIDPDGHDVYYYVNWGDGTNSGWFGPFASENPQNKSHIWNTKGTYNITTKTKDVYGAESDWGKLSVTMPQNKVVNTQFFKFLQKIISALRYHLGLY